MRPQGPEKNKKDWILWSSHGMTVRHATISKIPQNSNNLIKCTAVRFFILAKLAIMWH
ncbi:hypothetical protein MC5_05025 [Rickettsia australis str. Cutlack]|uniref:Uncharacterized protein n=1 Tax=Rickettsia australis (strain Cutlack) TaxID=1105110 RepID=H8K7P8_RICAC|nr:hypothetical protein MC5_05025 [Rickettsia australis str. Cutlack]